LIEFIIYGKPWLFNAKIKSAAKAGMVAPS
jgi:hypothetical protein